MTTDAITRKRKEGTSGWQFLQSLESITRFSILFLTLYFRVMEGMKVGF
jgi:hypothetical protein